MRLLIITLFLLYINSVNGQGNLIDEYHLFFRVEAKEYKGKTSILKKINSIPKSHKLSKLINKNNLYVNYILTNYCKVDMDYLRDYSKKKDSLELNKKYIELLQSDLLFNKYFQAQVEYFNQENSIPKDRITLDSITSIASKFFYASKYTNEGEIYWNVCVGKNGYRNSFKNDMKPLVEAFCFNTVMSNIQDTTYDIYQDYSNARKSIKAKNIEGANEVKLEYIRNEMYKKMKHSKNLSQLILNTYQNNKDKLSFIISDINIVSKQINN